MQAFFVGSLFVLFLFFLISPETVFAAAGNGLRLWGETLVPSLLPFILLNHLLSDAGGVALVGRALKAPVGKILRLPGEAAFIMAAGYSAGVPVSASLIAAQYRGGSIEKKQAERLLAFAANVSPLFLLSAVALGLLGNERIGPPLLMVNYGTNLLLTLTVCRFFPLKTPAAGTGAAKGTAAMRFPGLSDAIFRSVRTMVLIGAVVMAFFILIAFADRVGLFRIIAAVFSLSEKSAAVVRGTLCGALEITAGAWAVCGAAEGRLCFCLLSAVFAWGGLSAAAQISAELRDTDLKMGFYFRYKIIQGATAFVVSLWVPESWFAPPANTILPTAAAVTGGFSEGAPLWTGFYPHLAHTSPLVGLASLVVCAFCAVAALRGAKKIIRSLWAGRRER